MQLNSYSINIVYQLEFTGEAKPVWLWGTGQAGLEICVADCLGEITSRIELWWACADIMAHMQKFLSPGEILVLILGPSKGFSYAQSDYLG